MKKSDFEFDFHDMFSHVYEMDSILFDLPFWLMNVPE